MCASVFFDEAVSTASVPVSPPGGGQLRLFRGEPIEVVAANDRKTRSDFLHFPWHVQGQDPHWAPPLLIEAQAMLDSKHPFYRHGTAQTFVAYQNRHPVGRILATDDPRFCATQGNNAGSFGMFDCIDDQIVADSLLDAAANWLQARGRTEIVGPWDYSTNYPCGLLVEGFNTPQRILMNHNPPYYARLLECWGLQKAKDLHAWWISESDAQIWQWQTRTQRLMDRAGITIRPVRFSELEKEVERCKRIYHSAWRGNWGFVPMTDAEFEHLVSRLRQLADPNLVLLAEVRGEVVGMSITLPDWYEIVRPLNGRLTWYGLPVGLMQLAWNRRKIRTARVAVLGILEGYRRRGIAEMMIAKTLTYAHEKLGWTGAELGWTLEDNHDVIRTIQAVGAKQYKTYRVYQRALPR